MVHYRELTVPSSPLMAFFTLPFGPGRATTVLQIYVGFIMNTNKKKAPHVSRGAYNRLRGLGSNEYGNHIVRASPSPSLLRHLLIFFLEHLLQLLETLTFQCLILLLRDDGENLLVMLLTLLLLTGSFCFLFLGFKDLKTDIKS